MTPQKLANYHRALLGISRNAIRNMRANNSFQNSICSALAHSADATSIKQNQNTRWINREISEGRVPRASNFPAFSIFRVFGAFRGHKSVNQNEDSSILCRSGSSPHRDIDIHARVA